MKLLIADDEDYTREGLIEAIDWEKYGINEIMQAVNGVEAVKIAKCFCPDIILTDVRMPKMDGIEFATKMLELNPDSKVIFMSGYMEIQYLQSAIRLDAIDYIEKPIDIKIVEKALEKAVAEVLQKKKRQITEEQNQEIQRQKLINVLFSKDADVKTIEKLAAEVGVSLHAQYQCMIVKVSERIMPKEQQMDEVNRLLNESGIKALSSYDNEKRQLDILIAYASSESYRLAPLYQRILEAIPQSKLAIGMEIADYRSIYNSYRMATMAMNCAFYNDNCRLFQIDEGIMQKSFIEPGIYGEFLRILSSEPDKIRDWFEQLFLQLREKKYYHKEQVYTLLISLMTALHKKYPDLYGMKKDIYEEEQIQAYMTELDSLSELQSFVSEVITNLEEWKEGISAYSRVIRGVTEYVSQHYQEENLSVPQIAEHLHFSPAYLNVIFKQEMKVTLKQYLSNYRLEKAKKMLANDYDKITEVAEKCGYTNANYFAKVFKEAMGMTPAEWRKEQEGKGYGE